MEDEVHIETREGYLYAKISGMYFREKLTAAIEMIVAEHQRKPFSKLLIDVRSLEGKIGVEDRIAISAKAMQLNHLSLKVALLSNNERINASRFFVNYLSFRGTRVKLVNSVTEATKWFLG